jgi:orotate phosphoribosyltransferase
MIRDRQTDREWLVVVGLALGGVALAAVVALVPWQASAPERDEQVVGVVVTDTPAKTEVLNAALGQR